MRIPWVLVATATIMIVLSVPLILKKVPKNDLYGLRTKNTMSGSSEEWYQSNKQAGICICAAGILTLLACFIVPLMSTTKAAAGLICVGILTAAILLAIFFSIRKSHP